MLKCMFRPSETHKACLLQVMTSTPDASAIIALKITIYKTDRLAGEQVINVIGLDIQSLEPLRGSQKSGNSWNLALTTPEAHEAYQLFLNGTDDDLEAYMLKKLNDVLAQEEHLISLNNRG